LDDKEFMQAAIVFLRFLFISFSLTEQNSLDLSYLKIMQCIAHCKFMYSPGKQTAVGIT